MVKLIRFWVKFKFPEKELADSHCGLSRGCGVTAYSWDDAVSIMKSSLFINGSMPELLEVTKDVDLSTLDEGHVLPNIGIPIDRGIWFPKI